jgi:hypothetical protein
MGQVGEDVKDHFVGQFFDRLKNTSKTAILVYNWPFGLSLDV